MSQRFRLLNEAQVKALLPMADLIAVMEDAVARYSAREVLQPVRTVLMVGPTRAYFGVMPAFMPEPARLGTKIVTVFNGNETRGLPSHLATILLFDPDTGALAAIMDGRYVTEARTAAVSAVSARHLARPGASRLAIIGTGVQARSHLEALAAVFPIEEARVWSPRPASRDRFVQEMDGHLPGRLRAADAPDAAVSGADLVVVATASATPVLESAWVASGAHVMAVGACRPDQRELDPALVARARLYVDSRDAALVESGDVVMNIAEGRFTAAHIAGEIGEVVRGGAAGRTTPDEVTIFKSLGMAVEDVAAADLVLRRAADTGAGTVLEL